MQSRTRIATDDFEPIEWCHSPNYGRVCGLASDEVVFSRVKAGYLWEPELVVLFEKLIRPGSVVIDAGANIGLHSLAMAIRQPEVKSVLAFEPHPEIFRCLEQNAARDPRIRPVNKALGSIGGTLSMPKLNENTRPNPGGMRMFTTVHEFAVEVATLDSFELSGVSLIKIDVEGYERDVIRGGIELIKREKPALIVEILPDDPRARRETIELICGIGYTAKPITAHDVLFESKRASETIRDC